MNLDAPAPTGPAWREPWQAVYEAAHRARGRYWSARAERLPRPTVSIGNLHWGGGGKTPLTAALAAHLRDRGSRVAILSRGYGSRAEGVRLVSHWDGAPLLGPGTAGDEPVLLAGQLPGVAVVVSPDRHRAGRHALERLDPPPDVFLLDDGFSHLKLARDLDLLAFPAADPFVGGRLPPAGRLREPLAATRRADAVVLTGLGLPADGGERLAATLRRHGFAGRGFVAPTVVEPPRLLSGEVVATGTRVLLVSAIARPASFESTARDRRTGLGLEIADHLVFRDHHAYPSTTLQAIERAFRDSGAEVVVTTSKDRVKLHRRLDLPLAEVPLVARPEPALLAWLDRRLAELAVGDRDGEGR